MNNKIIKYVLINLIKITDDSNNYVEKTNGNKQQKKCIFFSFLNNKLFVRKTLDDVNNSF